MSNRGGGRFNRGGRGGGRGGGASGKRSPSGSSVSLSSTGATGKGTGAASSASASPSTSASGKSKSKLAASTGGANGSGGDSLSPLDQLHKWTGKSPVSQLHELCQKRQWNKPVFRTKTASGKGNQWTCKVVVSKYDKKTSSNRSELYPCPKRCSSEQEAKHFGAVYALFQVNYKMPMYRVFPLAFRDYWCELDDEMKNSNSAPPEPFADPINPAQAPPKKAAPKKKEYPAVNMNSKHRDLVEKILRLEIEEKGALPEEHQQNSQRESSATSSSSSSEKHIVDDMMKLGFLQVHVEEALLYCPSKSSALAWLCAHIPEKDLPPKFQSQSSMEMTAAQHDSEALAREYMAMRLCGRGFGKPVVRAALQKHSHREGIALRQLLVDLLLYENDIGREVIENALLVDVEHEQHNGEDEHPVLDDEFLALDSIFESKFEKTSGSSCKLLVEVEGGMKVTLVFEHLTKSYPNVLPTIYLECEHLPTYSLLGINKRLLKDALDFLESPMLYSVAAHLESIVAEFAHKPPPLREIFVAKNILGAANDDLLESVPNEQQKRKTKNPSQRKKIHKDSVKQLQDKFSFCKKHFSDMANSKEYAGRVRARQTLPTYAYKKPIMDLLGSNQVVVISGETGCGKSTQIPQLILEQVLGDSKVTKCNVIVTQPRRLAAIGLAERVSNEVCSSFGELVGYSVQLDTKAGRNTSVLFATTGIVLRKIQYDPDLEDVTHLVIDEVHERSLDSDFLLLLVKGLLKKRKDLKIVLMSATADSELFSSYFGGAPIYSIPGRTFPVTDYYLDDIAKLGSSGGSRDFDVDELDEEEFFADDYDGRGREKQKKRKKKSDESINFDRIVRVVSHICENDEKKTLDNNGSLGSILIFLPGIAEVQKCIDALESANDLRKLKLKLLPLHSSLTLEDQKVIFDKPPQGVRKIIAATNIAETSITVEDVVYVIDSGRVKEIQFDPVKNLTCLVETWTSQASCRQRQGRAGRVRAGVCYKIFSKRQWEGIPPQQTPEILRVPLERLCLQLLTIKNDSRVFQMLSKAVTPPSKEAIEQAKQRLLEIGAISKVFTLTPLGKHISNIPVDVKVAKFMIFGAVLGCLDPVLTIAACLNYKAPFVSPMDKRDEAQKVKLAFASGKSDHIAYYRAYEAWVKVRSEYSRKEEYNFCRENFLSIITLRTLMDLKKQYAEDLFSLGFVSREYLSLLKFSAGDAFRNHELNANSESIKVIKAALCAGLYPNVARVRHPDVTFFQMEHGTIANEAEAKQLQCFTKDGERVFRHMSSVTFAENKFEDPYVLYSYKLSTSKVYIRDITMISAYPLLLFCGSLEADHHKETVTVDGWLTYKATARVALILSELRKRLDVVLDEKIEDPSININESRVTKAITGLLEADGMV
eukprot:Nk52_evm47s296 gene=Nk52_evmTU47s296